MKWKTSEWIKSKNMHNIPASVLRHVIALGCSKEDRIRFCCQSSPSTKMSVIFLPGDRWPLSYPFLLSICSALLSPLFCCHTLSVCLSPNYLPLYLHPSVYLPITFSSIPLSFFFQPLSFIQVVSYFPQRPRSLLPFSSPNPFKTIFTSPPPTCFLRYIFTATSCGTTPTLLSLHV